MKYPLILTILILILPMQVHAFDFHGVKSGMTKEEVSKSMKSLGAKNGKYDKSKWEEFKSISFPPHVAVLKYNHNEKLMEMSLGYSTYKLSTTAVDALKSVIKSKFKGTILELENTVGVVLLDVNIMNRDIEYYKKKFKKEL
jgi:hypothetical protein